MSYLLDTNVVSNYFRGIYENNTRSYVASIIYETTFISVITRIELLSWRSLQSEDENIIKEVVQDSIVLSLSEVVILQTVEIRRVQRIKIPDAIIASTAIVHNLQLLTHNTNDFINIKGLTVVNPAQA